MLQTLAAHPCLCCPQLLTDSASSGKYALIVATPSNVINMWGGVLSLNQVRCHDQPYIQRCSKQWSP